jgi:hypothetical protein
VNNIYRLKSKGINSLTIVQSKYITLGTTSPNPFDMGGMNSGVGVINSAVSKSDSSQTGTKPKSTVQTLLGEHSNLVNLDDLVTSGKQPGKIHVQFSVPFYTRMSLLVKGTG